jgi:nucleoside-diphosphate-sugar epimerase
MAAESNTPQNDAARPDSRPSLSRVLVTGAGGSVGGELVGLLLNHGYAVRATVRPGRPAPHPAHPALEVAVGDLTDAAFCDGLTHGCAFVVHTAAVIDVTLPREALEPINLTAVERLRRAALRDGVARFVHLSSASTYAPSARPLGEDSPQLATSPYEATKLEAEQLFIGDDDGVPWTILRPSMIYGPRNRDLAAILPALPFLSRHFLKIGIGLAGGPSTNWVHARDVARACLHVLEHPAAAGRIFNVADDCPKPFGAIFDDVWAACGDQPTVRIPLARWMRPLLYRFFTSTAVLAMLNRLIGGGWMRLAAAHGLGGELRPKVFRDIGLYATADWIFDASRLAATGFRLEFPDPAAGWADTLQWYRSHGWVPGHQQAAPTQYAA